MSEHFHPNDDLADFSGMAPLFPLPNAVFYPRILFPLHIFERRYRKMTEDALAGDRLIAMALMKPGWELLPEDRVPPIYEMVCLSRITAEERLPDGRFYLVLQGLSRARVVGEAVTELPYRIGELEVCPDQNGGLSEAEEHRLREQLLRGVQSLYQDLVVNPMFVQALDRDLPLGVFCDVLVHALRLPPGESQRLLSELDLARRAGMVLEALRSELARREAMPPHFPPNFSRN